MKRLLRRLGLGLGTLLLIAALGACLLLRASLPRLEGEAALPGLRAPVAVARDAEGVPTLRGTNRLDLVRATGFLHAQERFFQMDLMRRDAAGELSALFGAAALEHDKARRLHRFRVRARELVAAASAAERRLLEAYAEGVNAGLAELDQPPFEYLLLGADPVVWRPEDTLLVVFAMYFDLQDEDASREARLGLMHELLPRPLFDFLVQAGTEWDAPLVGGPLPPAPLPGPGVYDLRGLEPALFESVGRGRRPPAGEPFYGSNSWAVAGRHTASGRALLANDMHLGLRVPNTWYRLRLVLPETGLDITGVSLPGVPLIAAGSNGHIAWGFTNSYGDWVDLVKLRPHPRDPDRYLTPQGYRAFEVHEELIAVKGAEPVWLEVRETVWGPVLDADRQDRPRALKWLAHTDQAINLELLRLETARGVEEALAIAPRVGMPPQNLLVADEAGNIGWTIIGRIPRRAGYDPRLPADWSRPGTGWQGWLAPEEYPRRLNPPGGRLWTANNRTMAGREQALIGDGGYALGARARQIRDGLFALEAARPADMLAIQLDDRALFLERWRGLLLDTLSPEALAADSRRAELRHIVATGWTGRASTDSVAYRLVRAWRSFLHDAVFAALTAEVRAADPEFRFAQLPQSERPLWELVNRRPAHLLNPRYPSWEAQLLAAVDETLDYFEPFAGPLAARTWGERNTAAIGHPLAGAVPLLGWLTDMPRQPLPGDQDMPRVQGPAFGASERFAVSPGREAQGYFHMPAGQSGHPLAPYYGAGHTAWARGEPRPFLPGEARYHLNLVPEATEPEP